MTMFCFTLVLVSCDNYDDISKAQSDSFIKNYTPNQENSGARVCKLRDGGYALLGNTVTLTRETDICLIITDDNGNSVQKTKTYGGRKKDRGYCLKQLPDGGFVILGSRQNTTLEREDLDVYLIRTDRLGDTLWTRTFDEDARDDEGLWLDTDESGNIMMVGYAYKPVRRAWHFIVDQNGNPISGNNYSHRPGAGSADDEARYVRKIKEGWLVIGTIRTATETTPVWLITNEYTLASPYPAEKNTNEKANAVATLDDSTFYACGTVPDGTGGTDVLLYKFSKVPDENEYRREWDTVYTQGINDKGTSILMNDEQLFILSTQVYSDKNSNISVISTNLQGENPRYESYGGSSQMESHNFEFAGDGGLIISGTNKRDFKSSLVMIKTRTGGKL